MSMIKGIFKRTKKRIIYMIFMCALMFVFGKNSCYAFAMSTISDTFPESYQGYIDRLKQQHPSWVFKAFYTHLDWTAVLNSEASGNYSRIQDSAYGDAWKRLEAVGSSSYDAAGFVLASRAAVAYTLDSRNFLDDEGIFQFRVIDKNIDSDTEAAVNAVAYNTPMYDALIGDKTYANVIQKVGVDKTIAPTFIVSRIRQETGCDIIRNGSINGKNSKYPGYYNFFNIGAVDGNGAVQAGINLAYSKGWNTQELAIAGGMDWLKDRYLKYGQNTVYFQKFDVANPYGNATVMLSSQYMTNILAPKGEAKITYNGLSRAGTLNNAYTFYIPIYDNMPSMASPVPTIGYYENDDTIIYLDDPRDTVEDIFYIRSSADSSNKSNIVYTLIETPDINKKTIIKRTKKGIDTGWDYVEFEVDGKKIEGYVWNSYVYEYKYNKVTGVKLNISEKTLKVGENFTLTAIIEPLDAKYKDVEWSTSNNKVATVDSNGKVTGVAAGSVVITAKSKDQGKTATCVVNVTDKEPSITLNKEKYTVLKDGKTSFDVTITDTDITEYDVKIDDETIAKIQDGKILGIKVGETKITLTLKGTEIKSEATVSVVELGDGDIVIDESLTVTDDIITKVEPGSKASEIVDKIATKYTVEIKNISGTVIEKDNLVGTGTTINIKNDKDEVISTYTIVIYGDVDGDGKIYAVDYQKIKNHIMSDIGTLSGVNKIAADVDKDGKVYAVDYQKIKNHIMSDNGTITQ